MAAFEVIALDTATPQLRAPGAADTYTFPRAVEMPLGTANGVLYLNGSKVVTSGSGLTFDGTTLVGTVSDAGTALKLAGATGKVRVRPYVDSTFGVVFDSTNAAESAYLPMSFYGTNIYTNPDTAAIWRISGSEQMRLTGTGLGIGTNLPGAKLHTVGASGVLLENTAGGFFQQIGFRSGVPTFAYYDSLEFGYATAQGFSGYTATMRLTSSGNLGLGVTPSAWTIKASQVLTSSLSSDGNDAYLTANGFFDGSWKYVASDFASQYYQVNGAHAWRIAPSGTAGNAISFTQAMTLHASGGLSVGGTTDPGAGRASISGDQNSAIGLSISNANLGASASSRLTLDTGGGSAYIENRRIGASIWINVNGADRVEISNQGNVVIGTAAIATNATNGFLYVPGCAGTPTGTPATYTGRVPIVIDTTNNKLYFYSGGAWRDAGP